MSNVWVDAFAHYGVGTLSTSVRDNLLADGYADAPASSFNSIALLPWDADGTDFYYYAKGASSGTLRLALAAGATDPIIVSAYYAVDSLPAANGLGYVIGFLDGSNVLLAKLVLESTGKLSLYDKNSTLLVSTSSPVITPENATHLEMKLTQSTGAFALKVGGTQVINATGLTLTGSGATQQLGILSGGNSGSAADQYISHLIVRDTNGSVNNDFVGDRRVAACFVNSDDDAHQGWTPRYRLRFGIGVLDNTANSNSAVTAASSTSTDLGSGDFTIETSVRFASLPTGSNKAVLFGKWDESNNRRSYQLYMGGPSLDTGNTVFQVSTDGSGGTVSQIFSWPWAPETDRWYHVAVVRSSGEVLFFIDGVQQGVPFADSNTYYAGAAPTAIGGQAEGTSTVVSNTALDGWFDEVRLTVGVARYTGDFTPPSDAFPRGSGSDPDWSNVALLCGFDSSVSDESSYARTMTARNGAARITPDDGAAAYQTLNKPTPFDDTFVEAALIPATAILTQTAQPANTKTVTVGTKDGSTAATYTWKTSLSGAAFEVLIGATLADSLANLVAAINAAAGAGTLYGAGTTANFDVSASTLPLEQIEVTALTPGTDGNSIACSTNDSNGSWSGSTLSGGEDIPPYSQFGFERPPNNTTLVDSITLVNRQYKTDSGSCNVQASFVGGEGGVLAGANNAITTSAHCYRDTFESDPDTGEGLTVSSVVSGKVKLNRTA